MKTNILLMVVIIAVAVSMLALVLPEKEFVQVAKFRTTNILSDMQNDANITNLSLGHTATITVDVEKLTTDPISDIMVKAFLENSKNGQYLLIDKPTIHAGIQMSSEDFLEYDDSEIKTVPFARGDITEPMVIGVTVIDSPEREFLETVRVVLFADGLQMDEKTFDVKITLGRI